MTNAINTITYIDNGIEKTGTVLKKKDCTLFKETTALVLDEKDQRVIHVVKTNSFKGILEKMRSHVVNNHKDYIILKAQYSFI